MMRTLHVNYKVCAQLFRMILAFGKRFCNDGYQIALYLNMTRILRTEQEIIHMNSEAKKCLKEANFYRFQNAAVTVWAAKKWIKVARRTLQFKERRLLALENEKAMQMM